jgi:hypothetical protein
VPRAHRAARSDTQSAELLTRLHDDRLSNLRMLVDAVARNGRLRRSDGEAVETIWALANPYLHQLLTHQRGWKRRYRGWLADTPRARAS